MTLRSDQSRISAPSAIIAIVFGRLRQRGVRRAGRGEADPPLMQPAPAPQPRWLCSLLLVFTALCGFDSESVARVDTQPWLKSSLTCFLFF